MRALQCLAFYEIIFASNAQARLKSRALFIMCSISYPVCTQRIILWTLSRVRGKKCHPSRTVGGLLRGTLTNITQSILQERTIFLISITIQSLLKIWSPKPSEAALSSLGLVSLHPCRSRWKFCKPSSKRGKKKRTVSGCSRTRLWRRNPYQKRYCPNSGINIRLSKWQKLVEFHLCRGRSISRS